MNSRAANPHAETPATDADAASASAGRPPDALDDTLPADLERDFIQLLLQSPHRLYLYWTFAHDPHATLREAFGEVAAHYRLAVRLVNVESGEEFLLEASRERAQWFEVYPRHVYRAEVGFHAAGRPFVRLLSSNTVTTPPDSPSHLSDEAREFQLEAGEFAQLLAGAGYERYAQAHAHDAGADQLNEPSGAARATNERQRTGVHASRAGAANEYPHR
ncbi:MAG TPA: DUF4912 domain-containing protein [Pyrinomonadaceae bacterium]|nr:DUF4912 domain-containing protein [Pyrinomonadaceae bacterium]